MALAEDTGELKKKNEVFCDAFQNKPDRYYICHSV
jgi:hypothetical protein